MSEPKRLHVITWGCQMNVYDSARMADTLAPLGYAPTATPEDADMVILNTCHIRERAAEKVFSELGKLRRVKEARAAAGQRHRAGGGRVRGAGRGRRAAGPRRRMWTSCIGPQTYHRLPEMVARAARAAGVGDRDGLRHRREIRRGCPTPPRDPGPDRVPDRAGRLRQVLLVLRRPLHPRRRDQPAPETVLAEARRMVEGGTREITLLGQNVNAWAHSGWTWRTLVRAAGRHPRPAAGSATPPATRATWPTT